MRWDGPYNVVQAWPNSSVYTLDLPEHSNAFPTFHSSLLKPYIHNDDECYPSRAREVEPPPVLDPDTGEKHQFVERILDRGRGWQYLVRWVGSGPEHDLWLPGSQVDDLKALDVFLQEHNLDSDG
ncbi:hypothetical protein PHLCEN_2v6128 [Hermanssonia centrifuga]|uniref:Chromo domain-containing protein n=1 Tax=Hermanssonia centrifuga TaxID=98765 RepID=A0A2R6P079_9APHY|nr:hypothetical protein PHLCEN_2v6128 [Hermanssonia centrifuga]